MIFNNLSESENMPAVIADLCFLTLKAALGTLSESFLRKPPTVFNAVITNILEYICF